MVLACIGLGQMLGGPAVDAEWNPPEPLAAVGAARPVTAPLPVQILRPDGPPAGGAKVVLVEPELALAVCDEDGRAEFRTFESDRYRFQAFLPGYEVLDSGVFTTRTPEPFTLRSRALQSIAVPEPVVEMERRFRVVDTRSERPLPNCLIRGSAPDRGDGAFWLAISDAQGAAVLAGTPAEAIQVEVFAPGRPPWPAWSLEVFESPPGEGSMLLGVRPAELRATGLPAGEVLDVVRLDVEGQLPLARAPSSGALDLGFVPAGRYALRVGDRELVQDVTPEQAALDFREARPRPAEANADHR